MEAPNVTREHLDSLHPPPYNKRGALIGVITSMGLSMLCVNRVCGYNLGCRISYSTVVMIIGAYIGTIVADRFGIRTPIRENV